MTEKNASIRLTVNGRGVVAGLRALDGPVRATARRWESILSVAVVGSTRRFTRELAAADARIKGMRSAVAGGGGILSSMGTIERRAERAARAVDNAFRASGGRGGGDGALGGLGKIAGIAAVAKVGSDMVGRAIGMTADLTKGANDVYEAANALSISSRQSGQDGVDPAALTAEFFAVAKNVKGITGEAAAAAAQRYVSMTGDLDTARASLVDFATAASASGSGIEEIAATSAAISQQFGIKDPGMMRDVLATLIDQGKKGSFELKDAAALMPRLAAAGAAFGLDKGFEGVKILGGLTQIARSGTGSGEQAATAVENLFGSLQAKADDLKRAGVDVYRNGKARDVKTILVEAIARVGGGDVSKKQAGLISIFGREGMRALNPLVSTFNDAFRKATGNETARTEQAADAVIDALNRATGAAGRWGEVVRDSAQAQATNSARMTAAWEELKGKASVTLLPVLTKAAEGLAKHTELFAAAGTVLGVFANEARRAALTMGLIDKGPTDKAVEAGFKMDAERAAFEKKANTAENLAAIQDFTGINRRGRALGYAVPQAPLSGFAAIAAAGAEEARLAAVLQNGPIGGRGVRPLSERIAAQGAPDRSSRDAVPPPVMMTDKPMKIGGVVKVEVTNQPSPAFPASSGAPTTPGYWSPPTRL